MNTSASSFAPSFENLKDIGQEIKWVNRRNSNETERMLQNKVKIESITNNKFRFAHFINIYPARSKEAENIQNITMASIEIARKWMKFMFPDVIVDIYAIEGPEDKYNRRNDTNISKRTSTYKSNSLLSYLYKVFHTETNESIIKDDDDNNRNNNSINQYQYVLRPHSFYSPKSLLPKSIIDIPEIVNLLVNDNINSTTFRIRPMPLLKDILSLGLEEEYFDYTHIIYSNIDIGVLPNFYDIIISLMKCRIQNMFINRYIRTTILLFLLILI